jgi:hypothetical protein
MLCAFLPIDVSFLPKQTSGPSDPFVTRLMALKISVSTRPRPSARRIRLAVAGGLRLREALVEVVDCLLDAGGIDRDTVLERLRVAQGLGLRLLPGRVRASWVHLLAPAGCDTNATLSIDRASSWSCGLRPHSEVAADDLRRARRREVAEMVIPCWKSGGGLSGKQRERHRLECPGGHAVGIERVDLQDLPAAPQLMLKVVTSNWSEVMGGKKDRVSGDIARPPCAVLAIPMNPSTLGRETAVVGGPPPTKLKSTTMPPLFPNPVNTTPWLAY